MEIRTSYGIACTMFVRDAYELLEKQIERAHDTEIYYQGSTVPRLHPMSASAGVSACSAVAEHIKWSTRLDSVWKIAEEDKIQCVIGCVQLLSD